VFLGAGGAALPLLQKSGIPEGKQYGGFPVSGLWLVCNNQAIINQHYAKVYGQAAIGAPPMSVPHLDTRVVDGKSALLFGPYAGFTTKFLKTGSWLDWIKSIRTSNLNAIWSASKHHMDLTRYLITEVFKSHGSRLKSLKEFYPQANLNDWVIAKAGQRVQIIKQCDIKGGKLEFGTEIVSAQDGSLATLLGASPGASVSVTAMLDVIERFFPTQTQSADWQKKYREMIPSYGRSLVVEPHLISDIRADTIRDLKLQS
jgi:malate dehydrogenase (quinone)